MSLRPVRAAYRPRFDDPNRFRRIIGQAIVAAPKEETSAVFSPTRKARFALPVLSLMPNGSAVPADDFADAELIRRHHESRLPTAHG